MKNNLLENLKTLQKIKPDSEYSEKSLNLIQAERQLPVKIGVSFTEWLQTHKVLVTSGITGVLTLALIILTAVSYLPGNKNSLVAEANDINNSIQIRLNEIKYQIDNNKPISSSIIENINGLLIKAVEELSIAKDLNTDDSQKLEEILEKIKNTRDVLEEINSQLDIK